MSRLSLMRQVCNEANWAEFENNRALAWKFIDRGSGRPYAGRWLHRGAEKPKVLIMFIIRRSGPCMWRINNCLDLLPIYCRRVLTNYIRHRPRAPTRHRHSWINYIILARPADGDTLANFTPEMFADNTLHCCLLAWEAGSIPTERNSSHSILI